MTTAHDHRIETIADVDAIRFEGPDALVPVIAQDSLTGRVLMLAYANRESLERTLETGWLHFWSRARRALWKKGETSGNVLELRALWADCDADTVLAQVTPAGPVCHTGERTCFGEDIYIWSTGRTVAQGRGSAIFGPKRELHRRIARRRKSPAEETG